MLACLAVAFTTAGTECPLLCGELVSQYILEATTLDGKTIRTALMPQVVDRKTAGFDEDLNRARSRY